VAGDDGSGRPRCRSAGEVLPLLDEYLKRFPRAKASLGNGTLEDVVKGAVMVRCRLR
jgi:hypothetical protein